MTVISKLLKLMVKCTILERIECCLHRNMEICESNWIKGKTSKYHVWQSQCLSLRSAHGIEPLQNDIQLTTLVLVHMQELHGSPKVWTWTWVVLMLALVATGANSYNNGATKFRKTCPCNSCRLLDQYVTTIKIENEWPTLIASNHFFELVLFHWYHQIFSWNWISMNHSSTQVLFTPKRDSGTVILRASSTVHGGLRAGWFKPKALCKIPGWKY